MGKVSVLRHKPEKSTAKGTQRKIIIFLERNESIHEADINLLCACSAGDLLSRLTGSVWEKRGAEADGSKKPISLTAR